MKTKILTTALVLGLSSVAFATPAEKPLHYDSSASRADHSAHFRPGDGMRRPLPMPASWSTLSTLSRIQGKQTINVGGFKSYSKLKLDASRGNTFIDKLVIVFANGTRQVVDLDKSLAMRGAPLVIDLEGKNRRIAKVVVYGKSNRRAAISVLAA
jgi:hypothetical protein